MGIWKWGLGREGVGERRKWGDWEEVYLGDWRGMSRNGRDGGDIAFGIFIPRLELLLERWKWIAQSTRGLLKSRARGFLTFYCYNENELHAVHACVIGYTYSSSVEELDNEEDNDDDDDDGS